MSKLICSMFTLFSIVCCSAVSIAPIAIKLNNVEFYRIQSSNILRLKGGGLLNWLDPRTPVSWPTHSKDVIPADGSVGGHFTLEEICGSGRFIGEFVLLLRTESPVLCDHLSLMRDFTGEISPFSTCIGIFGYLVFAW